jgi:glutamine cyclotransferase
VRSLKSALVLTLACVLLVAGNTARAEDDAAVHPCRVLAEYPHDPATSTQGLFFSDGLLYESSGGFGESYLTVTEPATGRSLRSQPIEGKFFAEGLTIHDGRLFMLTWLSGTGFIHSPQSLELLTSFAYRAEGEQTEGWGLTFDGARFILSCGTAVLRFHRPEDFARTGSLLVHDGETPVRLLNELEAVGGVILANVWKSDRIAVINPGTGRVVAWIDLSPLRKRIAPESGVANGIAYDAATGRLFVTGKHWDKLFVIDVDAVLWRRPVTADREPEPVTAPGRIPTR